MIYDKYCFKIAYVADLDLIGPEGGALIEYAFGNVFIFSEYVFRAWDRRRTVIHNITILLFQTEDVWFMNWIKYTEFDVLCYY